MIGENEIVVLIGLDLFRVGVLFGIGAAAGVGIAVGVANIVSVVFDALK